VLASESPRRREILENLNLKLQVIPSIFEEIMSGKSPEELALVNAEGKAREVAEKVKNSYVIGVDTIVECQGEVMGKPKNEEDAFRMIKKLSSYPQEVISGICIIDSETGESKKAFVVTKIEMEKMKDREIENYINSGEGKD